MARKEQAEEPKGANPKLVIASIVGIVVIIAVVALFLTLPPGTDPNSNGQDFPPVEPGEITTFIDSGEDIELIDGKPVIRLFSTTWCPHCKWIKPTYDRVAKEYVDAGKIVAYHWEVDTADDTLTLFPEGGVPATETSVFRKFNPGGSIPTFVFGGKYYRVGNGHERQDDLVAEEAEFRGVIEALILEASG
ncbi:MAG: thioredoxin family protein [archaeon]|jgi:thiol-disulfide isomerase/thioredoxin|nr:thioredoxin family protein [archaeon]